MYVEIEEEEKGKKNKIIAVDWLLTGSRRLVLLVRLLMLVNLRGWYGRRG